MKRKLARDARVRRPLLPGGVLFVSAAMAVTLTMSCDLSSGRDYDSRSQQHADAGERPDGARGRMDHGPAEREELPSEIREERRYARVVVVTASPLMKRHDWRRFCALLDRSGLEVFVVTLPYDIVSKADRPSESGMESDAGLRATAKVIESAVGDMVEGRVCVLAADGVGRLVRAALEMTEPRSRVKLGGLFPEVVRSGYSYSRDLPDGGGPTVQRVRLTSWGFGVAEGPDVTVETGGTVASPDIGALEALDESRSGWYTLAFAVWRALSGSPPLVLDGTIEMAEWAGFDGGGETVAIAVRMHGPVLAVSARLRGMPHTVFLGVGRRIEPSGSISARDAECEYACSTILASGLRCMSTRDAGVRWPWMMGKGCVDHGGEGVDSMWRVEIGADSGGFGIEAVIEIPRHWGAMKRDDVVVTVLPDPSGEDMVEFYRKCGTEGRR